MKLKLFGFVLLFISTFSLQAAIEPIQYINKQYEPDIKTVLLTQLNTYERFPAIDLNSSQQLKLIFDELKPDNDNYQYTFIHCSSNWEPSFLRPNEYLKGNLFETINDYSFSTTTFQVYTHYEITFPVAEMMPKLSGNYILKVYRNYDESDIILTHRFMVVEDKFLLNGTVSRATMPSLRSTSQEVDFLVDIAENSVPNPMMDVKTTILQNLRWDNATFDLKPRFINGRKLDYNYEDGNVFDGGNEFRYFDIRSLRYLSYNVRRKFMENNIKHVLLYNDNCKINLPYLYTVDYNGKCVIDNRDGQVRDDAGIEGDYCDVYFTYVTDKIDKDIYVFGELTDWEIKKEFKMEWNENFGQYEAIVKLKQAYYNYYFVTPSDTKPGKVDVNYTEGNHFETENDYYILAYNKNIFMQYDELLGTLHLNSRIR